MKKICALLLVLTCTVLSASSNNLQDDDSERIAELNAYWDEVSRTVNEGDFKGYSATFHKDGVFVTGSKNQAYPISKALERWEQDFIDTKSGKTKTSVEFRFSRRLGDDAAAHETGMFFYKSVNTEGVVNQYYIHFEALLVKKGTWQALMEYQKSEGTEKEWNKLK